MTQARRTFLRSVMELAWGLYRADKGRPDARTFADALAGAWKWTKGAAARQAAAPAWATGRPAQVAFGSMLQSPIRRSLTGKAYAFTLSRDAGRLTSRLGA